MGNREGGRLLREEAKGFRIDSMARTSQITSKFLNRKISGIAIQLWE